MNKISFLEAKHVLLERNRDVKRERERQREKRDRESEKERQEERERRTERERESLETCKIQCQRIRKTKYNK